MEEKKDQIYNYCTEKSVIGSELWRAAFIAKIGNIKVPDDIEVRTIPDDKIPTISSERFSDALAHLLIMYGAGYISYANLDSIARNADKYKADIYAAESFVIKQSNMDDKERVSEHLIQNMLFCCINSKKYSEIQTIGFDKAQALCETAYTTIRNGFVFIKDVNFLTFLLNADEPMGVFGPEKIKILTIDQFRQEFPDNKSIEDRLNPKRDDNKKNDIPDNDIMPDMPFVLNLNNLYYILQIYDRPYAVEFICYAKEKGIPFDENFSKEYSAYIRRNKRQFTVSAISRKREICGDEINWFDYGTTRYADKKILIDSKFDLTEHIDLSDKMSDDADISDEELAERAVERFLEHKHFPDKTVLEITFCGKKILRLLVGGKLADTLNSEKFRKIPFDYNNVWTTVMEWSRSKLIQKKGNSIVVPDSEMQKLNEKDRKYAERMIEEQYSLKKGGNKMLQKLSELKSYADKQFAIKGQQQELKNGREAGITEEDSKK